VVGVFLGWLESPALGVGILLARGVNRHTQWRPMAHEVLLGRSIVLLIGGLLIGWAAGGEGVLPIAPLFMDLFKGVLALFLLEMGLVAGRRLGDLKKVGAFLVVFGITAPLVHGMLGVLLGTWVGLSAGGTTLLGVLAASASYIAAPAAVRLSLPEANPTYSLTAALAITFPFNITFGVPLFFEIAKSLNP